MKNLFIAITLLPFSAFSQTDTWEYCTAYHIQAGFSSKSIVYVDYGQKVFESKAEFLYDSTGKADLKSLTEGFNLLGAQGWEMTATYSKKEIDMRDRTYFIFKRKRHTPAPK